MASHTHALFSLSVAGVIAVAASSLAACSSDGRAGFTEPGTEADAGGAVDPDSGTGGTTNPGCKPEDYVEAKPNKGASLASLKASYSAANAKRFVTDALALRYPIGKAILEGGLANTAVVGGGQDCVQRFLRDTSSPDAVLRQAATLVHECGHFYDLGEGRAKQADVYVIRPDLSFACQDGDTTARGGKTFARSLLRKDAYYSKRPACGGQPRAGCDFYADIYLDGDANDGQFQSGDQGYSFLLEEAAQYVNSIATAWAFEDAYAGSRVSERDGILTFMWYMERYLKLAREQYPAAYELIAKDECWRKTALTIWDRGELYLREAAGAQNLGIEDGAIRSLVDEPALKQEIDELRKLQGCK